MEYEYVGYTVDRRVVKGRITADSEKSAGDALLRDGYQILNVKPIAPFLTGIPSFMKPKIKPEDVVMFSRQLALLLESGVGIVQSLDLLRAQSVNKNFSAMLSKVVTDLRAGLPLSVALEKHPGAFSKMFCKVIAVGEQTGQLESVLRNLAGYSEQSTAALRKVKQAATYPVVVLILAILVGILMVTFILPPILAVFKNLGGNLPLITRILIWSIAFATSYGIYIFIAIGMAGIAGYLYTRTPEGAYRKDALLLRLPVLGRLILLNTLSRICRSITLLFRSGLPLPDILTLTADSAGNIAIAKALRDVEQDIIKGEALAGAMRKRPVFLPLMVEMTRVGEETGNLDSTLTVVSDSFEIEAADKLQTLLGLIEPAMTVVIGLVVGFLALSIFVPIYSTISMVGGGG